MATRTENIIPIYIEDEMKGSYLDYSMSIIASRALSDVKDGLKPSQRRVLVAMRDLGLVPNRPHRKCAKIVGTTEGDYHPHGDMSIYMTLARMAQEFSLRYPLVDPQGNFGSVDGDPPGAMRYTEARLSPFAVEMLADIEYDTVDHMPNYDGTQMEPVVLPSRFPNLLCNGSSGIAVGMAANLPPHNLSEVVDALIALIENPQLQSDDLLHYIKGPDFPTGAIIYGTGQIRQYVQTGRGKLKVRARVTTEIHPRSGKETIVINEIPYQVNKANLIEKIADLVRDKKIQGIADLRDESDRQGMRIVVELKRDVHTPVVLNQLYKHSYLETTFGVIMLALINGRPQVVNLKGLLQQFIAHRHEVLVRKTRFLLERAQRRAHILEGLRVALNNTDELIALLRASESAERARKKLFARYKLTEAQVNAILDMRLQRLTGLERKKLVDEYRAITKEIAGHREILASLPERMRMIKEELQHLKEKYGDERRTEIVPESHEICIEDLIAEEDMVITISHAGYIKRLSVSSYRRQNRGGKGVTGMITKEEDFVEHLFIASTHSYILFFTDKGRCYWLKVHEIPEAGRVTRGKAIVNLIQIQKDERVAAFLAVRHFDDQHTVLMATKQGIVNKTNLSAFASPRRDGIMAINLQEGDGLIEAALSDGSNDVVLGTQYGLAIRFPESEVRETGRNTIGVRGINLQQGDELVGMVVIKRQATLLTVTEKGYGKRTDINDYRITHRGGKGIINIKTSQRNGQVVAIKEVVNRDELMIISLKGVIIRLPLRGVRSIGRNTQGVRLINLSTGDRVIDVARVITREEGNAG